MIKLLQLLYTNIFLFIVIGYNYLPPNQTISQWSYQERIPGLLDDTLPPILISDQNRTVHAFTSQWIGEGNPKKGIIYSQWRLNQGWITPIDIILSPLKNQARIVSVFMDQDSVFHLIFFGGDNTGANIYYSKAQASIAGKVSGWSTPMLVGASALDPENGAIVGDDDGNLVILFSGNQKGNGLYGVYSSDKGDTWSISELVFPSFNQLIPSDTEFFLGTSGLLYTVWTDYDFAGQGVNVNFASFDIQNGLWSSPFTLAQGTDLGVSLPNVIEHEGSVIASYYNSDVNALWMKESGDRGRTWTDPVRISKNHIGRNGAVSFARDSDNILHLIFCGRIPGKPDIHGTWHTTLQNGQLGEVEAIVSGPLVVDKVGDKGFDPSDAKAVIIQGNVLLVTWRTDPGNGKNGGWYSYKTTFSPELPTLPLPTPQLAYLESPTSLATPPAQPENSTGVPLQSPTNNDLLLKTQPQNSSTFSNPALYIVIGLIPVAIAITVIFVSKSLFHRNPRE